MRPVEFENDRQWYAHLQSERLRVRKEMLYSHLSASKQKASQRTVDELDDLMKIVAKRLERTAAEHGSDKLD